ncbi:DUF3309 domain-containing protein [Aliihoeflea aestuarii]|jgi:uncharacterized protein (DUF983 family)|uniref:DUF3309 family protein n=1 Tax=Aliihoeflea aestuarii TaxID=453840 RepID=UPI0020920E35|nr:DUF3309 domain-containing protein [Aliihoeflea aestuarii]MCO6391409.1 DUF3309 domain-containing protein [Aliihoeflea aestuarii]
MALVLIALIGALAIASAPIWPHSRRWPWWPSIVILVLLSILLGLLAIERIEAM